MSDGGGETGRREQEQPSCVKRKYSGDEFVHAVAKISVAQICESAGFQAFQQSALEKLADIAVRYVHNIGKIACWHSNLAGRTEGNVFDAIQGLEELGLAQGFSGASDVHHCLGSSGTIRELTQYVGEAESPPFAYSIPCFPLVKDRVPRPSFLQVGEEPPGEHIPSWLPAFPDPQTFLQLPTENKRATDSHVEKIEPVRQQSKTEWPLLSLQERFSCNGIGGPSLNDGDIDKGKQVAEANPFLAAPLHSGEKNVSPVVLPPKLSDEAAVKHPIVENCSVVNHVSVLDTFNPAIEAIKSRLGDDDGGQRRDLLDQRPGVQFKIKIGKKSLGTAFALSPQSKGVEKIASLFRNDDDKNDKQRRVEKILKDSMDNTQELAQL